MALVAESVVLGCKGVLENVVSHPSPQRNCFHLVENPVDAKIDSALAVFFLGLRQVGEAARLIRAHGAIVVARLAVKFVGDKGKRDLIRPVETAHGLKKRASKSGMARRIGWKGRRKIRTGEITGRRA